MAGESDRPAVRLPGPIGVLALQGSFPLHQQALEALGARVRLVRRPGDLPGLAGLVLPGGESTVMAHLAESYGLLEPLCELGHRGLPMFGTCAGAILLGRGESYPRRLELAPVTFLRNAYGTQLDSFTAELQLDLFPEPFHGVFIRAPQMGAVDEAVVRILGRHGGLPVLVEHGSLLLSTFHPELTDDLRIHRHFLERCAGGS